MNKTHTGSYTDAERETIKRIVAENPDKLTKAFELAAQALNRKVYSVQTHYYTKIKPPKDSVKQNGKHASSIASNGAENGQHAPRAIAQGGSLVLRSILALIPKLPNHEERIKAVEYLAEA